jgi:hypothetical protein
MFETSLINIIYWTNAWCKFSSYYQQNLFIAVYKIQQYDRNDPRKYVLYVLNGGSAYMQNITPSFKAP